jgi:cyd operon protein YbgT
MWYFTWILGVLFASFAGIVNVVWLEFEHIFEENGDNKESQ